MLRSDIRSSILARMMELDHDRWMSIVSVASDIPLEYWDDIPDVMQELVTEGHLVQQHIVYNDLTGQDVYWYRLAQTPTTLS